MRAILSHFRVLATVFAIAGALVMVVSLARHPRLPAIEANAATQSADATHRFARAATPDATVNGGAAARQPTAQVTIGPKEAIRMHGGSIATDLLHL